LLPNIFASDFQAKVFPDNELIISSAFDMGEIFSLSLISDELNATMSPPQ
jgi:hypothetical protein